MALKIDLDRGRLADFCRRWRITEFALFGSVLREDFRPESDVDVLVSFEPEAPWSLWDLSTMRHELEEIFGREVDLVEKKALRNPFRRHAILTSTSGFGSSQLMTFRVSSNSSRAFSPHLL